MGLGRGGVMGNPSIFSNKYGGSEYTVWFTKHPNGLTISVEIDDLPRRNFPDKIYPTYAEAHAVAIETAEQLIRQMKG
ncbi:hypothetical protein [Pseudomonas sp.]|uniref:hypothetical protein n=1 Tax=Pseudomonas sp. TaxID=306 RepID=UPI0028994941|nr:hypothetical protein [Pseudomonas sp.]